MTKPRVASLKFSDVRVGDMLVPDVWFTCMAADKPKCVQEFGGELFIPCSCGKHFLSGQENEDGNLIGLSRSPLSVAVQS